MLDAHGGSFGRSDVGLTNHRISDGSDRHRACRPVPGWRRSDAGGEARLTPGWSALVYTVAATAEDAPGDQIRRRCPDRAAPDATTGLAASRSAGSVAARCVLLSALARAGARAVGRRRTGRGQPDAARHRHPVLDLFRAVGQRRCGDRPAGRRRTRSVCWCCWPRHCLRRRRWRPRGTPSCGRPTARLDLVTALASWAGPDVLAAGGGAAGDRAGAVPGAPTGLAGSPER